VRVRPFAIAASVLAPLLTLSVAVVESLLDNPPHDPCSLIQGPTWICVLCRGADEAVVSYPVCVDAAVPLQPGKGV